jgi:hypothetical protein
VYGIITGLSVALGCTVHCPIYKKKNPHFMVNNTPESFFAPQNAKICSQVP